MATKISKSMLSVNLIPSVNDYGAKGDGVTDDTAAFIAFLADVQVGFVPPGNYKLTGQIKPRSDQYIYGCGKASRLIYAGPNSGTFIFFDAVSRSSLKELQIQIPYADYTSVSGITASNCSEIEIEGIRFNGGIFTNTSAQIQYAVTSTGGSLNFNAVTTVGWIDRRGR